MPEIERLLEDPAVTAERQRAERNAKPRKVVTGPGGLPRFVNEPMVDFTRADHRAAFPQAIADVRTPLGRTYPLFIDGRERDNRETIDSVNPANPSEMLGTHLPGRAAGVDLAVAAAKKAFPAWRDTAPPHAPTYLLQGRARPPPRSSSSPPGRCWRSASSGTRPMPTSPKRSTSWNTMPAK